MATTGFWPVKGQLKEVIEYARNPDKTTEQKYLDDDLYQALRYAENDSKTDRRMYVSAINCPKQRAYESMMATKRRFGKLGGNVAYHGYQSFAEGEVTPVEAHSIGVETAIRMWGEDFEVVVTTHLNTENLHNHFVVNSVSFRTGRKFENHVSDHFRLREISDEICYERGKSVLEDAHFYGGEKEAYWARKSGKLTHREILRRDVEHCLSVSRTVQDVLTRLESMGYKVLNGLDGAHISVIAPGWQRPVRLSSIGYTKEKLNETLSSNYSDHTFVARRSANPVRRATPLLVLEIELRKAQRMDGIQLTFAIVVELLRLCTGRVSEQKNRPLLPMLREEVRKLDQYIEDYKLLCTEDINTAEELSVYSEGLRGKIAELEQQRSSIRNRIRRAGPEAEVALKEQAREVTKQIDPLRKQLRSVRRIEERSRKLDQLLEQERQMENDALSRTKLRERRYDR